MLRQLSRLKIKVQQENPSSWVCGQNLSAELQCKTSSNQGEGSVGGLPPPSPGLGKVNQN